MAIEDLKDSDTSKHSFVEMCQAFLHLRKHLRGQAVAHTNLHFVNADTLSLSMCHFLSSLQQP